MVSSSAPEMTPFSARNRLGAPSASDWGHFPAWEAGGIPFRAGKDTFFCSEPPRSPFRAGFGSFSCPGGRRYPFPCRKRYLFFCPEPPRSTFRAGMQPAAQIYGGGHGRACQKKKFVQKFFSFWNQQFLKKEMGVNLRCFGAAECWAQIRQSADPPIRTPASPHTSRAPATLYVRGLWGTTLSLRGRVVQRFPGYSRMRRMPLLPKWLI